MDYDILVCIMVSIAWALIVRTCLELGSRNNESDWPIKSARMLLCNLNFFKSESDDTSIQMRSRLNYTNLTRSGCDRGSNFYARDCEIVGCQ